MPISSESVVELTTEEQWRGAFPLMIQLRSDLSLELYLDLLRQMKADGYRLFALIIDEELVALAGLSLRVNFYSKRHVYIYDLVTDDSKRSHGYGERLLRFIHPWAKEHGADYVALESGIQRVNAHRFYEDKLNYDKWCFSFRKQL